MAPASREPGFGSVERGEFDAELHRARPGITREELPHGRDLPRHDVVRLHAQALSISLGEGRLSGGIGDGDLADQDVVVVVDRVRGMGEHAPRAAGRNAHEPGRIDFGRLGARRRLTVAQPTASSALNTMMVESPRMSNPPIRQGIQSRLSAARRCSRCRLGARRHRPRIPGSRRRTIRLRHRDRDHRSRLHWRDWDRAASSRSRQ